MEKFKEKIRTRTIWMSILIIGLVACFLYLSLVLEGLPQMPEYIKDFQAGLFSGVVLMLVIFLAKYLVSLKSEKTLKKLYIEEKDERTAMILQKTGAIGMNLCIIGLGSATVLAGFFNEMVFFSLFGATVFTALIKGFFKVYYHQKF